MLQYLIILLDNVSLSYCHADNPCTNRLLIPINTLNNAIKYGMKNNLMVQFIMPPYTLPDEYYNVIESIDNIKIGLDVSIYDHIPQSIASETIVIRTNITEIIDKYSLLNSIIKKTKRICICYKDIDKFEDSMGPGYINALDEISKVIIDSYKKGGFHEVNILTDILKYEKMNNCGAGITNITIAPNGKFYLCPAFYYDELLHVDDETNYREKHYDYSVGNLQEGIIIANRHLLNLEHAPICRTCDAYHCNRCIWLNRKLTGDVNTPSHQQCIISHIERNASRNLSIEFQKMGLNYRYIKEVFYLDPFDNVFHY